MNNSATTKFMQLHAELTEKLAQLQEMADNHFNYDPDAINFGHVGNIANVTEELSQILTFLKS